VQSSAFWQALPHKPFSLLVTLCLSYLLARFLVSGQHSCPSRDQATFPGRMMVFLEYTPVLAPEIVLHLLE
jgi:hypothetical protein